MRKLFLFSLFPFLLFTSGIAEKTKDLKENERIQQQLSKKLEDLTQDILSGEKNLKNLDEQINTFPSQTSKLEANIKVQNKELSTSNNQNKELLRIKSLMKSKLISLMAKDFAYDLPIPEGYIEGEENSMAFELLGSLDKVLSEETSKLSKDYEGVNLLIENKQKQIEQIRLNLENYNEQLKELQSPKNRQIKEINQQKTDRQIYAKKLNNLKVQQEELRATLDELKIIDKKEQVKEQKEETGKLANNNQKIRQIGSSYRRNPVKRYTGKKTIVPLDSFTIKQKFGNYVDPIYNIKIFNENVVLRNRKADATVKNVLDGRVVFTKNTTMLQRTVIIERNDGIHTIYAHLGKIVPNIKMGKRVKKGAVVGRIKDDLTFEVTQKNFRINPLELIGLN